MNRKIEKIIDAQPTSDGDGVKISRSIASRALSVLDPFLLLDELRSDDAADYIGGFPPHPHRGFETVTYMLEGQMRHKDSAGNEGVIRSGDIQWMTAGSGIIHSEMPEQDAGRLWGFQFWLNLPASQKMRAPRYQEIASDTIPEIILEDGKVRVLAGEAVAPSGDQIIGAATDIATNPLMLDVQMNSGEWQTTVPGNHTAFIYVYRGQLEVAAEQVKEKQLAVLTPGTKISLAARDSVGALVLAAQPLNEPVARYGPFVMNTQEEVMQAVEDYRNGTLIQAV